MEADAVIKVGSTSAIKADGTLLGMAQQGISGELQSHPAESRMPPQPEGEETRIGAMNRAAFVHRLGPPGFSVGIENGIRQEGSDTADFAVACVIAPDGRGFTAESRSARFPPEAVAEARRRGFGKTTVGQVMAEMYGSAPDDPHIYLTGGAVSRSQIIAPAVGEALARAMGKAGSARPDFLLVRFCGSERFLPVREVAPGLAVAFFNPLGDWALIEEVGEWLAEEIPSGTEVLLMPDGKAQALLHVMGRCSGLPTVVARKELKPYMALPAIEASVKSITTDRVQRLFLGADDANRIRGKRVAVVDDVVSSGGTLKAVRELLSKTGAVETGVMAVFTEGEPRADVISFGNLPLFKT